MNEIVQSLNYSMAVVCILHNIGVIDISSEYILVKKTVNLAIKTLKLGKILLL